MEWIFLAGLIIGALESINSSSYNRSNTKKIQDHYKPIIDKMQKDSQLIGELETAYRNRDAQLVQSILNASPFSHDVNSMRKALKDVRSKQKDLSQSKVSIAEEQSKINQEYNTKLNDTQSTGSIVGDLIKGGVSTSDSSNYVGSGYTTKDLEEVNKLW